MQNVPLSPEVENGAVIFILFFNEGRLEYEVINTFGIKRYTAPQNGQFEKIYEKFKVFLNDFQDNKQREEYIDLTEINGNFKCH